MTEELNVTFLIVFSYLRMCKDTRGREILLKSEGFSNLHASDNYVHLRYFQSSFCKCSPYSLYTGARAIPQRQKFFVLRNDTFGIVFKSFFSCEQYIKLGFYKWKYTKYTPVK